MCRMRIEVFVYLTHTSNLSKKCINRNNAIFNQTTVLLYIVRIRAKMFKPTEKLISFDRFWRRKTDKYQQFCVPNWGNVDAWINEGSLNRVFFSINYRNCYVLFWGRNYILNLVFCSVNFQRLLYTSYRIVSGIIRMLVKRRVSN